MSIYPIDFVTKAVATERLTVSHRQSVTQSNATYAKTVVHTASQWMLTWSWPRMSHSEAESVVAWLDSLNGQVGTFRYFPRQAYGYTHGGTTLAVAAYAYNTAVSVGGYAANTKTDLRAGQYLQIGTQLLRITNAAAGSDASGNVTISFTPELRGGFPAGTPVNLVNPCGVFSLTASEGLGFALDPDHAPDFSTITAQEDCNA